MTGNTLSHYRILGKLGAGGMGEVYDAEDTQLGRRVAIKILPEAMTARPQALERFRREARALAALNHPNIVTIYSVEEAEGRHFITMERVEGRPLDHLIPERGFELKEFFNFAIPLADALAAAHEKGFIHRDLKPSNVMVNERGQVKVIDFGLAKLFEADESVMDANAPTTPQVTLHGQILGTPAYMSPEQVEGGKVDHRTDIFSLGVLLFELVTGKKPFRGNSSMAVMSSVLRDAPPPLNELKAELPEHLSRIVRHCLHKTREDRYQSALDVRNELKHLQEETTITSSTAPSTGSSLSRPPAGVRWRAFALAGCALALLALAVVNWRTPIRGKVSSAPTNSATAVANAVKSPILLQLPASRQISYDPGLEDWPSWEHGGDRIVYSAEADGFKNLFIRSLGSEQATRITQTNRDEIMPAWNPANRDEIVYVRARGSGDKLELSDVYAGYILSEGDLWKLNLKSGQQQLLVSGAYNPTFATNGLLAFHRQIPNIPVVRIWTSDSDGRHLEMQTRDDSSAAYHLEPAFAPDGSKIVFRHEEKNLASLWVIDLKTRQQFALTPKGYYLQPVWSPSGRFVYFSSYLGRSGMNIWRIAVKSDGNAAGDPEPVTSGQGADMHPAISPDGKRMLFSILRANSDIWKMPVDPITGFSNGPPEIVINTSREDSRGAWSPDEKWIVFNSDRDKGNMNLWLHPMQSGSDTQVTEGPGGDYQADWAPDGRALIFFSLRSGNADIWTVELDERKKQLGPPRQLTTHPRQDMNPFVSPDGQHIAFMSDREGRTELFVMKRDGRDQRRVSQSGTGGHFLRWRGNQVVFGTRLNEQYVLALAALDGQVSEWFQFEKSLKVGGHASLSPDGSAFLECWSHEGIYAFPPGGAPPRFVLHLTEPNARLDYPVWSPTGKWVLFDRMTSQGGDLFLVEGLE